MSDTRARANRFARRLGSRARNGLIGRRSPGAGGVLDGEGETGAVAVGVAIGEATGAGGVDGRGVIGAGGGGVYAGTEIGVCDGTNGRAACGVLERTTGGVGLLATTGAGAEGVATEGHAVRGVGLSGGNVAPRGGVAARTGGASWTGVAARTGVAGLTGVLTGARHALASSDMPTGITPPHEEQRARTPPCGTFAGSTRYVVEHCGQLTFINHLQRHRECLDAACHVPVVSRQYDDQS